MQKIKPLLSIAALTAAVISTQAQNWDFVYSYRNVYSTNALNYVVEQNNIGRKNEGNITYWNPIVNGQEARLTQKFVFPTQTATAFLNVNYIYIANFSAANYGSGSLWGSKDGTNWIQLVNAPRPSVIAAGYNYSTNLPVSLMGASELWIQVRLLSQGWNIMAQFLRYDARNRTNNAFDLKVKFASPQAAFVKAFTVDYSNLLVGSNYQAQASSNLVNWTNWGAAFTATNSAYTNTSYQRVPDWNQLFFRLQQQ